MDLVPAIKKADAIFSYLEESKDGAYLKEISTDLNIPKSTAHRILTSLVSLHYIEMENNSTKYTLGPKFLAIARTVEKRLSLNSVARPFMEELSSEVLETVKLSVLRDKSVYVISSAESPRKMKITVASGTVFPPHVGAAGKLLLAYTDEDEREKIITNRLDGFTVNTITERGELRSVLQRIRELGFSRDREEETIGISAVAFPVFDSTEHVRGAVSIPYLTALRKEEELIGPLQRCAVKISRALGSSV